MTRARGPIRLDITSYSVVVTCQLCPGYSDLASSALDGWQQAARHETYAHPDSYQARNALNACRHDLAAVGV